MKYIVLCGACCGLDQRHVKGRNVSQALAWVIKPRAAHALRRPDAPAVRPGSLPYVRR